MKVFRSKATKTAAYTLVEALVASGVLLIAVSAASSMSLSLVTQEEINERSIRAVNYLDNAARLYRLGMTPAEITALLPADPAVNSLNFVSRSVNVSGLANPVQIMRITMNYKPSGATVANDVSKATWTGGDSTATRSEFVDVFRADSVVTSELPRVNALAP